MDQERIIELAANKSIKEINLMYHSYKEKKEIIVEAIRQRMSCMLIDTDYDNRMNFDFEPENNCIISAWEDQTDGSIWFAYSNCSEIKLDDMGVDDQIAIMNELNDLITYSSTKKIYFVNDSSETQWGVQLNDGRIVSLYDKDGNFYLGYDAVLDLKRGVIIRGSGGLTDKDIEKGYVTLSDLKSNHLAKDVECYDTLDFDMDVYTDDPDIEEKISTDEIVKFFHGNGYNVTKEAVNWCVENWKIGFKSGYLDQENGYHLFSPCGGNPLSIRLTTLNPLCDDWQTTYWC